MRTSWIGLRSNQHFTVTWIRRAAVNAGRRRQAGQSYGSVVETVLRPENLLPGSRDWFKQKPALIARAHPLMRGGCHISGCSKPGGPTETLLLAAARRLKKVRNQEV